ncbi:MAG: pyridoxamine 5'-phosphate oxidase [Phycisphaerae bacterium]|nr:pyridoxamine 5'-phosphate oxidase [Phycisphaerae bacterium]
MYEEPREPFGLLDESHAGDDPMSLFLAWFEHAKQADLVEPTVAALGTVGPDGRPAARMILLKSVDERGFVFFTHYESRKGAELRQNPAAALTIWWDRLTRQVRVEGRVEPISPTESDEYFQTRPRESQLSAWASDQSEVLASREALEKRLAEVSARFAQGPVPRPPHWGGLRLVPAAIEFWQGRANRLHDRLLYTRRSDGTWSRTRLSP